MKRILKLLSRMYPAEWRRRYGVEYEALLEDGTPRARDAFDVLWSAMKMQLMSGSFVRIVLPCALVGGLVGIAVSFTRPALYQSQTVVQVATDDPRQLDHQLAAITADVLTQPFLTSVVEKENLYPLERARLPMSDVVDLMRKNISIMALAKKNVGPAPAFAVRFSYPNPHVAQKVDEALASQFVAVYLQEANAVVSGTKDFLNEQFAAAKERAIKARIQSELQQLAITTPGGIFRIVNAASLPSDPFFPKRSLFGGGGLAAGFAIGLMVALVSRSRRNSGAARN